MSEGYFSDLASQEVSNPNFTKFSDLPPELRLKIWKLALPGPRILKMKCLSGAHVKNSMGRSISRRRLLFPSNSLDGLGMLHVCREARAMVLEVFDLLPARDTHVKSSKEINIEHPLYFDSSADILYFEALKDLGFFTYRNFNSHVKVEGVQRIGVAVDTHDDIRFQNRRGIEQKAAQLWQFATAFSHLKECVIVELRRTSPNPLFDFMQILEVFVEKKKKNQTLHDERFGPGSVAPFKVPGFTRMTKLQFQRVGELVRKYWG